VSPTIPEELAERVRVALGALEAQGDGRLPLQWRRRIRKVFGPMARPGPDQSPERRRRVQLDWLCAERVMPYWRAFRPDDQIQSQLSSLLSRLELNHPENK